MRDWLTGRYGEASAALAAIGITLILVSQFADLDWLRLFGALSITAGGLGVGTKFGIAPPREWPLAGGIRRWREVLGVGAALILAAPVVVGLVMTLAGFLADGGTGAKSITIALGALIGIVALAAVLAGLYLGIRSIVRAAAQTPAAAQTGEPNE